MSEMIALVVTIWIVMIGMWYSPEYIKGEEALVLIKECESKLPRDKDCKIIAVPIEANNE
jgi:hypothetical protein